MAIDKTTFANRYNNGSTGKFKDNTGGDIGADDVRDLVTQINEGFFNTTDNAYNGAKGVKPGVTSIATLKAIATLNIDTTIHVIFRDTAASDVLRVYELVSGTDAESSPEIIRPTDYAGTTNEKVWKLAAVGSSSGGWELTGTTNLTGDVEINGGSDKDVLFNAVNDFTVATNGNIVLTPTGTLDINGNLGTNIPMGGNKVTGLGAASGNGDAVRYEQLTPVVEAAIVSALEGLKWKDAVKVATTTAGTLASSFENGDTIDGVALVTGDRILIKDQVTQSENGIYIVAASGAPARSSDANSAAELEGATVPVQRGTSNANTSWTQTTDGITLGSSSLVFTQIGSSVPDANGSTKGIAKLYTATGSNTDGSMDQNSITNALALKAALASPTFTGTPAAPTAATTTNTTQVATTAFVQQELSAAGLGNKIQFALVQSLRSLYGY